MLWVARRAESKPTTIDEIHENERLRREQQERDQDRDRQQRRDPPRPNVIGTLNIGNNQQQYNDARGSRGSGIKQTSNRTDEDRVENRFNVKSVRELQSNDKRNHGQLVRYLSSTFNKAIEIIFTGNEFSSTTYMDQRIRN